MEYAIFTFILIIAVVLTFLLTQKWFRRDLNSLTLELEGLRKDLDSLSQENKALQLIKNEHIALSASLDERNLQISEIKDQLRSSFEATQELQKLREQQISELTAEKSANEFLRKRQEELTAQLEELNARFTKEFELVANRILEEKSTKFTDQNKQNIENILKPLNEKISQFELKVENTHKEALEKQSALREQLNHLKDLNQQITKETTNLTKALKGDNKIQGNWGELMLQKILEKSGLEEGREFTKQQSLQDEEGRRLQPDFVINLPGDKKMIIDSKVSLVAYERYMSEEDENLKAIHLKQHADSIKNHVTGLTGKNYHQLLDGNSPDFVLLFVAMEPAFAVALQHDQQLFNFAFDRNIVIVTPTTLLATLKVVDSLWQNERRQANALEIAGEAGKLYDKFVGLTEDLIKLGNQFKTAQNTYNLSMKKLSEGSGNLISKVEKLKKLGASSSKSMNESLKNRSIDLDSQEDEL